MSRTMLPRAVASGATLVPDCRVLGLVRRGDRWWAPAAAAPTRGGGVEPMTVHAEHVFVCGGAVHTPGAAAAQRHLAQHRQRAEDAPHDQDRGPLPAPVDHGDVPMHRVTEFSPFIAIGGSASRKGQVALALADTGAPYDEAMADWENISTYYAAIRSEGSGRVLTVPGLRAPVVTYSLTDADLSRLARGLVHLGELLLAAGRHRAVPIGGRGPGRAPRSTSSAAWWDQVTRQHSNLMTVHLTSSVRMGENRARTGADSFGRVWGTATCASTTPRSSPTPPASTRRRRSWPSPPATATSS